jgi:hypothetical protein
MTNDFSFQIQVHLEGEKIVSETTLPGIASEVRERIFRQVMDTREEMTRKALIELGWTPPKDAR